MTYYDNNRISQSKVKLFLESKEKYFYRYVSNNYTESDTGSLGFGRYYHTLVFQPELIKAKYIVNSGFKVDGMMGIFIEEFHKLHKIAGLSSELAKQEAWVKSGFKWSVDKVWEKFTKENENKIYYKYLDELNGKECIKQEDYIKGIKMLEKLDENTEIQNLLNPVDFLGSPLEVYNELEINWENNCSSLPLKSMLDRIIINTGVRTINILDLKTTKCSNLKSFKNDMKNYKYYIQAIFYINALEYLINNDYNWSKYKGYKIDFIFIPQYTEAPYHTLRPIRLSQENLNKGYLEYREALIDLELCMNTGVWKSDDIYSDSEGIVTLDLFKYDNNS